MARILRKVEAALRSELADFVSGLDEDRQLGRVMGYIVSTDFDRLDQRARQRRMKTIIERALGREVLPRIGPIVTMTPDEAAIDEPVE